MSKPQSERSRLLAQVEYDPNSGNYKVPEYIADDYQPGDDSWQDASGQWWVDGQVFAEVLSEADAQEDRPEYRKLIDE
jgi:hypothetical protein